ncbi:MAG: 30S ribosomal protein S2 [Chlamydiae bacterium]|nr:30S ribosomal protein S2 [Chlamydiota bacterium]
MQAQQEVTIKDLLEAGAHFGHQRQRWNPKMKRYIFEERNGIYIIDLAKTMHQIRQAREVVQSIVAKKQSILFVGTKKQARDVVEECADIAGEFCVSHRWLGGMLTNLMTIRQSVKKLDQIEKRLAAGGEGFTKKEISDSAKIQEKLERNLAGMRGMRKLPGLVIVVDPSKEHIAVAEARKLGIPVMGIVDTNCDPDQIDYVIPANDDALKSNKIILSSLARAIAAKKQELGISLDKEEVVEEQEEKKPRRAPKGRKFDRHEGKGESATGGEQ